MKKLNPKLIPFFILSFVGFFMLLDGLFVYYAHKTYTGHYTDNAYQKGLDFDKINKQSVYQPKTAWQCEIFSNGEVIKVVLKDAEGRYINNAQVSAKIVRPTTNKYDQVVDLRFVNDGTYEAQHHFAGKGQWDIRVKAVSNDDEFITTKRVKL